MKNYKYVRILGLIGFIGVILFLILLIILHFSELSVNPISNYISDYANSPSGLIFKIILIFHGFTNLAIAIGFFIIFKKSISGKIGSLIFGITAIGAILGGFFSIDYSTLERTITGTIHSTIAYISFPLEIISLFFFIKASKKIQFWKKFKIITEYTFIIGGIFLIWLFIAIKTDNFKGLAERLMFLTFMFWEIISSFHLIKYKNIQKKYPENLN